MKLVASDRFGNHRRGGDSTTVTVFACDGAAGPSVSLTTNPTFAVDTGLTAQSSNVQLGVAAGTVVRKETIWLP